MPLPPEDLPPEHARFSVTREEYSQACIVLRNEWRRLATDQRLRLLEVVYRSEKHAKMPVPRFKKHGRAPSFTGRVRGYVAQAVDRSSSTILPYLECLDGPPLLRELTERGVLPPEGSLIVRKEYGRHPVDPVFLRRLEERLNVLHEEPTKRHKEGYLLTIHVRQAVREALEVRPVMDVRQQTFRPHQTMADILRDTPPTVFRDLLKPTPEQEAAIREAEHQLRTVLQNNAPPNRLVGGRGNPLCGTSVRLIPRAGNELVYALMRHIAFPGMQEHEVVIVLKRGPEKRLAKTPEADLVSLIGMAS